jgi:hypothetical protein
MKYLLSFLLLYFFTPINAQLQDLFENDSITWVAEWEADYLIDDIDASDTVLNNRFYAIKYLNQNEFDIHPLKRFFSYALWEAIEKDQVKTFSDRDCKKRLTNKAALTTGIERVWPDNETEIDPITYETRFDNIYRHTYNDVMFYRARQVIYYNVYTAQFQLRVLAIAPLINIPINDSTNLYRFEPLFWFKPEMGKPSIHSENITWAQGFVSKENR